jgi:hypothetical protein
LSQAIITAVGILVWHLAALNSLALYTGAFTQSWFVAPIKVLQSKYHLLGAAAALVAAGLMEAFGHSEYLDYVIFPAGALLLFDTSMIYIALKTSRHRR